MKTLLSIVAILILIIVIFVLFDEHAHYIPDRRTPPAQVCINNLMSLDGAEQMWCYDNHKSTNDVPAMENLTNYTRALLKCPSGGTYTLGPVWKGPTCSIPGHRIP